MDLEDDDDLLESDDEALEEDAGTVIEKSPGGSLNARRLIERRLELRRLREQLDDPDFDDIAE